MYSSFCSGMIFPLTLYVPSTLGFLEAARYIVAALPIVVTDKRADMLPVPSGAGPLASSSGGLAGELQLVLSP